MTITTTSSAPLVAVVGATGIQGGSVIKALAESTKEYRVRGFTRDVKKPASESLATQRVEMVAVNLVVENKDEVYRVFAGADFVFLVTNFWEHLSMEKEISEGKLLVDAANAAGVKGIIWSGLMPVNKLSGGKYAHVLHFDSKAAVTDYGRKSPAPFVDVQAGLYSTNFTAAAHNLMLAKQADGSYAIAWPMEASTTIPIIDMEDYGLFVRRVLEAPVFPDGSEVLTSSEDITVEDLARQLSEVIGKQVAYKHTAAEEFWGTTVAAAGLPPAIATEIIEGFQFFDEFGYYGGKPSSSREGLGRPTRSWREFVKAADWSKALKHPRNSFK
ncbi:NAD(P)-binding protein [Mycena filopes]|nr:NAD(P)-binding protein [Mycena filopes]